tara:strand:- start:5243 stop:5740 length:498 start_codon:yes stop_codon:yes gene_type:complete
MAFDATFWVAISFLIFFGVLIYLKVPQNVNNLLSKMITDIKNEIDESEKLRAESKKLLDEAQMKLNSAKIESEKIMQDTKGETERFVIEMNDKFHKSSELKKSLAETKISQMKDNAIKEIKDTSINIAVESVKKIITTSVDKSKLDNLFNKNLEETKKELKKISS